MDELQEIFKRQIRELASRILRQPECSAFNRSTEADLRVGLGGQERMFSLLSKLI